METKGDDIKVIRDLMEKSVKFKFLSGLSIVVCGIIATVGALFVYNYLQWDSLSSGNNQWLILLIAIFILVLSIAVILFFSWRKSKRNGQKLFNSVSLRATYNLAIPLLTGGIFALIFFAKGNLELAIAGTLLFYGLALVNVSKYTFDEIYFLGIVQILLGLLAVYLMQNSILFWMAGFGICHIVFGFILYVKYDRKKV